MLLLPSCKEEKPNTADILFPAISLDNTKNIVNTECDLSEIFTDCRIIPLETSEKSLIGGRQLKVVKSGTQYYVKSENDVVIFDKEGLRQSSLTRWRRSGEIRQPPRLRSRATAQ